MIKKEIYKIYNEALVFSHYILVDQNIKQSYNYLRHKYDKIDLLNEAGAIIDGFDSEMIYRYYNHPQTLLINKIIKFAENKVEDTFKEVNEISREKDSKILLYKTKLEKDELEYDCDFFKEISSSFHFCNKPEQTMKAVQEELELDHYQDVDREDWDYCMNYIDLSKNARQKIKKVLDDLKPFCYLDDMMNYAKDLMAFRNKKKYKHKEIFEDRKKLLKLARVSDTEEKFLEKALGDMEFFTKLKYIKNNSLYRKYLKKLYADNKKK